VWKADLKLTSRFDVAASAARAPIGAVLEWERAELLVAASACTLRRTRVAGRGEHHPYFCREGSHDNLIDGFTVEERTVPAPPGTQLHGVNVEGLSSYNVWTRGDMRMGTFCRSPMSAPTSPSTTTAATAATPPRDRSTAPGSPTGTSVTPTAARAW